MQRFIAIILGIVATIHGRTFKNPILGDGISDYAHPGAIKVDGTYYIVTTSYDALPTKFQIHISRDLTNWIPAGYVFNEDNLPTWSTKNFAFWQPEIHKIGSNYLVYFAAGYSVSNKIAIGVAVAPHPSGPYTATDRPLVSEPGQHLQDPTIIQNNGNIYLLWARWTSQGDASSIKARLLNANGLSFASDEIIDIINADLPWENNVVEAPWYVHRGGYHYILYSVNSRFCNTYKVAVARSRNATGPYEKLSKSILDSNEDYIGPGHVSVVKDVDYEKDVIVFYAYPQDKVCTPYPRLTLIASLGWNEEGWPYVYDF